MLNAIIGTWLSTAVLALIGNFGLTVWERKLYPDAYVEIEKNKKKQFIAGIMITIVLGFVPVVQIVYLYFQIDLYRKYISEAIQKHRYPVTAKQAEQDRALINKRLEEIIGNEGCNRNRSGVQRVRAGDSVRWQDKSNKKD